MVITNREVILEKLNSDIKFLAESLIKTELVNNGDYSYDGVDEYWVDNYEQQFISPNGDVYSDFNYDKCVSDVVSWLNKEVKEKVKTNNDNTSIEENKYRYGKCKKCGKPLDMHYVSWCSNCTKPKELVKKNCVDVLMLLKWCDMRIDGLEDRVWEHLCDNLEVHNDTILEFSFSNFYSDTDEQLNKDLDFILENFNEEKLSIVYYKFSW